LLNQIPVYSVSADDSDIASPESDSDVPDMPRSGMRLRAFFVASPASETTCTAH
jgi:hypothetical protein